LSSGIPLSARAAPRVVLEIVDNDIYATGIETGMI
jgi:hypothetical protein